MAEPAKLARLRNGEFGAHLGAQGPLLLMMRSTSSVVAFADGLWTR